MNVKDITTESVGKWVFENGLGPDEASELMNEGIKDITTRRPSKTGQLYFKRALRQVFKNNPEALSLL